MKSAIRAIARNEEDYLLEWINYHLNLGFDHIFLCDNNNLENESTYRLCKEQPWEKYITNVSSI